MGLISLAGRNVRGTRVFLEVKVKLLLVVVTVPESDQQPRTSRHPRIGHRRSASRLEDYCSSELAPARHDDFIRTTVS